MKLLKRIALIVLALFFIMLAIPDLLLLPGVIVFGWIPAARRLLGNLPFSGAELSVFFGACALLVLGLHWFLRLFKGWSYRWTIALTGTAALVLLAVMSVVGVAHQFGWIMITKEPMFVRHGAWLRDYVDLLNTARALAKIAPTNALTSTASILCNRDLPPTHDGRPPWERFNVILVEPTNAHFAVMWPRDHQLHQRLGSALLFAGGEVVFVQSSPIPITAQAHAANSP